jgi:hypothetical protein
MTLLSRLDSTSDEIALGLCFHDSVLMSYVFWAPDLTMKGNDKPKLSLEQKLMYSDQSQHILFCTGRKIAKSLAEECQILRKALAEPIEPGQTVEGLVTTPGAKQMELVHGRILEKIRYDPLLQTLVTITSGGDNPQIRFRNGFVWKFRIEGMTGDDRNMIGIRAKHIIGDEQQLSNWACHDSRKMTALPDCTFMYAGVPDGRRGSPFYSLDQTHLGETWSRHKYSSFVNPINQTEEGKKKIHDDYGSEGSFSYQTLVLGQWGAETISSFPPGSIAHKPGMTIFAKEFRGDQIAPYEDNFGLVLQLSSRRCHSWAAGIDHGATSDPTVIIVAVRVSSDGPWLEHLKLTLQGVSVVHQARVFKYVYQHIMLGKFMGASTDSRELLDNIINEMKECSSMLWDSMPGGTTTLLDEEGKIRLDPQGKPIKMRNKQFMHELLRKYMTNANMDLPGVKLWLGNDESTVEELAATTERKTDGGYVQYYSPKSSGWSPRADRQGDHQRDALTFLCNSINLGLLQDNEGYSEAELLASLGWAGDKRDWQAPY